MCCSYYPYEYGIRKGNGNRMYEDSTSSYSYPVQHTTRGATTSIRTRMVSTVYALRVRRRDDDYEY
eukprot:scaffold553984_cov9-Prasinocladus_malaysianus.AAC.1